MSVERIIGGGIQPIGLSDAGGGQRILAAAIGASEAGGTPGYPAAATPGIAVPAASRIVGGGAWVVAICETVKAQHVLAGCIGISEAGLLETHATAETPPYPRVLHY